jgi:2-keto-4-pentenoate hydratase/2-oxohepta-3-ene-1,7-dioic acid hydratase in catechol pathway
MGQIGFGQIEAFWYQRVMEPRNIWAVGRNYVNHAVEMKAEVPSEPMIFLKAGGCANPGSEILLPSWVSEVHYEVELALKFDKRLEFSEFALALDLTERKLQSAAKAKGTPWTIAKSFLGACPISAFKKLGNTNEIEEFSIELEVNGVLKQKGFLRDLVFSAPVLREFLCKHFPVEEGDWLLTGTPAGVGPMKSGDRLLGRIPGLIEAVWNVI